MLRTKQAAHTRLLNSQRDLPTSLTQGPVIGVKAARPGLGAWSGREGGCVRKTSSHYRLYGKGQSPDGSALDWELDLASEEDFTLTGVAGNSRKAVEKQQFQNTTRYCTTRGLPVGVIDAQEDHLVKPDEDVDVDGREHMFFLA